MVVRPIEAGCRVPEKTAITGHTPASANSILQTYLATADEMADAAITQPGNSTSCTGTKTFLGSVSEF